jgi:threonine dehydrogenase-like Zn-dependent dehydrogenase
MRLQKERGRSIAEDIFPKLVEHKGEMPVIKDQLPTIFHAEGHPPGEVQKIVMDALAAYRDTLPTSHRSLLDRYEIRDAAVKVVGIGSVGTNCWVMLFMAGEGDPLFLQVKEARASVLEPYAGASVFSNHGQRVVDGYRLMQPASDMFLGWTQGARGRDFFVRQLRDIKISIRVETFGSPEMELYSAWCGRALALSHARAGSSIQLSGYMGTSDIFDRALASFSVAYADQNEKDHAALKRAIRAGKIEARFEEY